MKQSTFINYLGYFVLCVCVYVREREGARNMFSERDELGVFSFCDTYCDKWRNFELLHRMRRE
jgi:hypothetical protein